MGGGVSHTAEGDSMSPALIGLWGRAKLHGASVEKKSGDAIGISQGVGKK